MLIDAIRLKGFLSHYGLMGASGNIEPVEVDFRDAALWLVHGPNGAGKSALVFDAVGLALYGEHRGGRSGVERLIHQDIDEARIEVDLTLNGEQYRVQCTLRKKGRKKSGGVYRLVNDNWQREPDTENNVEAWAEENLRMKWKTFQSTVLLRQGEADVFLKAKATERRERLMELIDLTFYKKLGQAAARHLKDWKEERDNLQNRIDEMEGISDEALVEHEQLVETTRQAKEAARNLHESKQAEFAAACRAQQLKDDLEREQQKKEGFDALLAQTERIEQNLERFSSLNTAIPRLENVYTERARLAAVCQEALEYREALAALVKELSKLQEQRKQAECEYAAASGEETAVNKRLTETEARQRTLQQQAGQLKQIERLEARIQEAKVRLEPYRPILEAAANIEEEHGRQEALAQAVSLLKNLDAESNTLTQCKTQLTEAETNQTETGLALIHMQTAVEHAQVAVDEVLAQQDELQNTMAAHREQSRSLREKLEHRQALTGEEICPTCGSALDNEAVQARLASEREKWQIELDHLEQQIATLAEDLKLSKENLGKAKRTHSKAEQEARTTDKNLIVFRVKAEHVAQDVGRAQEAYDSACKAAGEWVEELDRLDTLETELEHLKESSRWVVFQEAQKVETQVGIGVTECRRSLDELPQWTGEEREQLSTNLERVNAMVSECQKQADDTKTRTVRIAETLQKVQMQHTGKNAEKRSAESNLQASSQRVEKTEQEVTRLIDNLPEPWRLHPAHQDEDEFQLLKAEWESLAEAPDRAKNLRTAQREANVVQGAITTLESQLAQIPQVLRRPVTEVEGEVQGTREQLEKQEKRHEKTLGALGMLKQRRQQCTEFEEKRDHAAREWSYYERLARVFGQQGLQARVVQVAQDLIRHNANETLRRLSRGMWEIELREDDTGSELEILARDLSQPGGPVRAFEYLSGGEKFRVAVSLAVGIGQSISGGRSTDTLLIDEGFGSLDEDNRGLMVDELRRLSEEVLQGGRVIVISHQEDVCDGFTHRCVMTKDENGRVQVEMLNSL